MRQLVCGVQVSHLSLQLCVWVYFLPNESLALCQLAIGNAGFADGTVTFPLLPFAVCRKVHETHLCFWYCIHSRGSAAVFQTATRWGYYSTDSDLFIHSENKESLLHTQPCGTTSTNKAGLVQQSV